MVRRFDKILACQWTHRVFWCEYTCVTLFLDCSSSDYLTSQLFCSLLPYPMIPQGGCSWKPYNHLDMYGLALHLHTYITAVSKTKIHLTFLIEVHACVLHVMEYVLLPLLVLR